MRYRFAIICVCAFCCSYLYYFLCSNLDSHYYVIVFIVMAAYLKGNCCGIFFICGIFQSVCQFSVTICRISANDSLVIGLAGIAYSAAGNDKSIRNGICICLTALACGFTGLIIHRCLGDSRIFNLYFVL